jgi:hypothetical protein
MQHEGIAPNVLMPFFQSFTGSIKKDTGERKGEMNATDFHDWAIIELIYH